MITGILIAAAIVGGTGLLLGLFLGAADKKFKVEVDEREQAVREALPGNNCGGCGMAGCDAMAKAIVSGEAPVNACPVGGEAAAAKIAQIMGAEAGASKRMTAFVKCSGDCEAVTEKYNYYGTKDCAMMPFLPNSGSKSCSYGCCGYGTCAQVCQFDAIHVVDGVAVVDKEKCKACGKCIAVCPKHLIGMEPYKAKHIVACSSQDKGPVVMKACTVGCIGCGICKKNCPADAITVENFVAKIDQEKCTGCGLCKEKCPKKAII
mgnify:CR=1 FL=1